MFPLKGDQTYWTTPPKPGISGGCTQVWGNPSPAYPGGKHNGIDLGCATGTAVYAAWKGKVVKADYDTGYGRHVRILHPNGHLSLYAHLTKIEVAVNQEVADGAYLGLSGGGLEDEQRGFSSGPHLHYEVRTNPFDALSNIDPVPWIDGVHKTVLPLPPISGTAVVISSFVNLRFTPGLQGRKLGMLLKGDELQIAPGLEPVILDEIEWTPLVFFVARWQEGAEYLKEKVAAPG